MTRIVKAMKAGFGATLVLALLLFMTSLVNGMPRLELVPTLGRIGADGTGLTHPALGWLVLIVIGSAVGGLSFALLVNKLPGRSRWAKGSAFGAGIWLLPMVIVMPPARLGLIDPGFGFSTSMLMLALLVVYGLVLADLYLGLPDDRAIPAHGIR